MRMRLDPGTPGPPLPVLNWEPPKSKAKTSPTVASHPQQRLTPQKSTQPPALPQPTTEPVKPEDVKVIAESYGGEGFTFARNPCLVYTQSYYPVKNAQFGNRNVILS